jgi:hypothetical protein
MAKYFSQEESEAPLVSVAKKSGKEAMSPEIDSIIYM